MKLNDRVIVLKNPDKLIEYSTGRIFSFDVYGSGWVGVYFESGYRDGFRPEHIMVISEDMTPEAAKLMVML